jgi:hypothetical protein
MSSQLRSTADRFQSAVFDVLVTDFDSSDGESGELSLARRGPPFQLLDLLSWNLVLSALVGFCTNILSGKLLDRLKQAKELKELLARADAIELIVEILTESKTLSRLMMEGQRGIVQMVIYSRLRQHGWSDFAATKHSEAITNAMNGMLADATPDASQSNNS